MVVGRDGAGADAVLVVREQFRPAHGSTAARRGLELDDAVLDYLLRRVGRDLSSLTALLERMDKESLAAQRRVTVPFVRQLLAR